MADKQYQNIKIEREGKVTFLYFNRPEKRNAMSPGLLADMVDALGALETDAETGVLVLTYRLNLVTSPSMKVASPRPPPNVGLLVRSCWNCNSPDL